MAKKIVKVNEEKIRGYMVGDIPDAIENEDIIVVEVPEEENNERQDTEKETARKNPKPCNMPECDSNFRQKYLVNTPHARTHPGIPEPQAVRRDKELSPCDSSRSKYCELYQ